ncbi:hypothetical protein JOJ86_004824 [Rhodococcus percolatus]|nr:hypothetical protein [Rhodococcus opacus]MBP2207098.1 hypothetical protein [Rhodococcus opacus]
MWEALIRGGAAGTPLTSLAAVRLRDRIIAVFSGPSLPSTMASPEDASVVVVSFSLTRSADHPRR